MKQRIALLPWRHGLPGSVGPGLGDLSVLGSSRGCDGRTRAQPAEGSATGEGGADILDIARSGWLAQSEALAVMNAGRLHQIGNELILDSLSDDQCAADLSESHGCMHRRL